MDSRIMDLKQFDELLAGHDWHYDYSDDYSVWTRGMNESRFIAVIAKSSDAHRALFNAWQEYIHIDHDNAKLDSKRKELI